MNIRWLARRRGAVRPDRTGLRADLPDRAAARTDRGQRRAENQDSVIVRELPDGAMLAAVADGVGGTGGGKLASACAVETLLAEIWMTDADDPARTLQDAFAAADRAVRAKAEQLGLQGMATTLVAAVVRDGTAWIANAGDSRAYLYRDGALAQLTEDHSWVAEQVRVGRMTAEEASESSFRNIITRAVGAGESARPDTLGPIELPAGTLLLLCSDGLHGVVSGDAIAAALARGGAPGEMADRLVEMANESGGPDNVSAVIVRG